MPAAMQAKLLRVLETRSYRPLGAEQEYHSDFRLIAATHQPLTRHVEEGQFRADLYHRLCQCLLLIAPCASTWMMCRCSASTSWPSLPPRMARRSPACSASSETVADL